MRVDLIQDVTTGFPPFRSGENWHHIFLPTHREENDGHFYQTRHDQKKTAKAGLITVLPAVKKFPSSFFHMPAKISRIHHQYRELVVILSSYLVRKEPLLGGFGCERGLRNPRETL